jgi:hypothetical protein
MPSWHCLAAWLPGCLAGSIPLTPLPSNDPTIHGLRMTMPRTELPAIDHFNHIAIRPLDIASPSLRQLLIPTVESL